MVRTFNDHWWIKNIKWNDLKCIIKYFIFISLDNGTNDKTWVKKATQLVEGSRWPLHKKLKDFQ